MSMQVCKTEKIINIKTTILCPKIKRKENLEN